MIASSSYGALSATSTNTIQGSRPTFASQLGVKKLGFTVRGVYFSENEGNIEEGVVKLMDAGVSLSEFEIKQLTSSDFNTLTDYYDADGDLAHSITPFTMDTITFEWRDSNNQVIPTANYNKTLGCGSNLNLPLTLKIKLPNVKVHSHYGNPRESLSTSLVQEYKIGTATGICFAKPNSLAWQSVYGISGSPIYGGGYSSDFDPVKGFKASASPKFPTTGFPKASFTLIMTSNANDYTFSSNDSAVVVDTAGKVTLNSKPSGAVTIKAIFKNDTSQVHYYTFNPTTVWVVPKKNPANSDGDYTYAEAKTACVTESSIPSRAQLTNSPMKTGYEGVSSISYSDYTRAVGEGVFGEWGRTDSTTYPGSQWVDSRYWTRDPWSISYQFVVNSSSGDVNYLYSASIDVVACLE
ncbi:hypothetical protein RCS94_05645 [Orbaceae bacterium ac157xtp]